MERILLCIGIIAAGLLSSCGGGKSQQNQEEENKPIVEEAKKPIIKSAASISVETISVDEITDVVPYGCICWFSRNEEDDVTNDYIYSDDMSTVAVMKINGEVIVFQINEGATESMLTAKSNNYQLKVTKKQIVETGNGSSFYEGVIKVTNSAGMSVEQEIKGVCGC